MVTAVSKQQNPGGGGGGGSSDFAISPENVTFDKGAKEFTMPLGSHQLLKTCKATLADTATVGSDYTYNVVSTDTGVPFKAEGTLEIITGGNVTLDVKGAGPITATSVKGTWAEASSQITITWSK